MKLIAIDGPAGSGKSTVARAVADRLGLAYLDTGAMYRAVAFAVLDRGVDPADAASVAGVATSVTIEVGDRVLVDGEDATAAIRGPEVTLVVSQVAAHPEVRRELVERQRAWVAGRPGAVVEGRDIGSVVFPEARLKIYLTASDDERARRRAAEGPASTDAGEVAKDLARRDRFDSNRTASPLLVAEGARVVDTTGRSIDQVIEEVLAWL